jgi:hypothetical protein
MASNTRAKLIFIRPLECGDLVRFFIMEKGGQKEYHSYFKTAKYAGMPYPRGKNN